MIMPNWVFNRLCIKKDYLDKVVKGKDVDFGIIAPRPEDLDIPCGGDEGIARAVYLYKERGNKSLILGTYLNREVKDLFSGNSEMIEKGIIEAEKKYQTPNYKEKLELLKKYPTLYDLGKQYFDNEEKYGTSSWYDWDCKNWGTKWNACNTDILDIDDDLVEIKFDTPWSTPYGWLDKLSKICPFYLEWEEEQGYHGEIYCDGETIENNDLEMVQYVEDENGDFCLENEDVYTFDEMKFEVANW